jgi:hypothetical protein
MGAATAWGQFQEQGKMDQKGLYINIGINNIFFTWAIFNDSCHSYMAISKNLQQKLQLPTLPIKPRILE